MTTGMLFDDSIWSKGFPFEDMLVGLGWRTVTKETHLEVWEHPEHRDYQVLRGVDVDDDERERLDRRSFRKLIYLHGEGRVSRVKQQVFPDGEILQPVIWRKISKIPGMIPFPRGVDLMEGARKQLLAAAKARQGSQAIYGNSNGHIARTYLDACYMGASREGSYIITAHSPEHKVFYDSDKKPTRGGKDRRKAFTGGEIIATLTRSLLAVREVLDDREQVDPENLFKEVISCGVSYEMVQGLSEILLDTGAQIEIPRASNPKETLQIVFKSSDLPAIVRGAEQLKTYGEQHIREFVGYVTHLQRDPNAEDGEVRLIALRPGGVRTIRVALTGEAYQQALQAHENDEPLRVTGDIHKDGKFYRLDEPEDISVLTALADQNNALEKTPSELSLLTDN